MRSILLQRAVEKLLTAIVIVTIIIRIRLLKWCGGWDSNPRIPKEQGCRRQPAHSKLRTPFLSSKAKETCAVDRAWRPPPAQYCKSHQPNLSIYSKAAVKNNIEREKYMQASNVRPRLFGTNGVRGVYGQELNHDIVIDLCYALGTYFGKGPIVVGYDGRKSSPALSRLVRSTLNSAGLDTADSGLVPTPCLQDRG